MINLSITIFYKGNLKQPDDISDFVQIIEEKVEQHNWSVLKSDSNGIAVDIPECETLIFNLEKGKLNNFVKYIGQDTVVLENIFDTLLAAKPFFKRLMVTDDFGMWDKYVSQFSKDKFPPFRELKNIEKDELMRWFDLPKGSDSIFGMELAQAALMYMICKDMSRDLTVPLTKNALLSDIDERIIRVPKSVEEFDECFQFIAIVENWYLKRLVDKNGNAIDYLPDKTNDCTLFAWLTAEMIFGVCGGSLGSKHSKLHRYVDSLIAQGYDFKDNETFLRFIYSVVEYLGGYRIDDLIIRTV